MKKSLIVIGIALSLAACNRTPKVDLVKDERLSRDMVTPEIEVTHRGCGAWSQSIGRTCRIIRIESTATAISNGGSNWNRENAYNAACLQALSNVSHWINQDVVSERELVSFSKNNEVSASNEVQNSTDRSKNFETSNRENANDMNREVRNTIRVNSRTFLKGWKDVRDGNPVVGKQEVKCVQRWDAVDEMLLNKFTGR